MPTSPPVSSTAPISASPIERAKEAEVMLPVGSSKSRRSDRRSETANSTPPTTAASPPSRRRFEDDIYIPSCPHRSLVKANDDTARIPALPKSFSVLRAVVESSLVASIHRVAESGDSRKLRLRTLLVLRGRCGYG